MTVQPIHPVSEAPDRYLSVRYGATPRDWEHAAEASRFVELIDGRLIVHSPAGLTHQRIFGFLLHLLRSHVEHDDLGEVLTGPFTMDLALERKFEPDVIYVGPRALDRLADDRLIGPADLAIEIASPSTGAYDRGEKRECYRVGGVGEYWMIDPFSKKVTVDRPAGYEVDARTEGWAVSQTCPGFALQAEWLWMDPLSKVGECLTRIARRRGS